jgi:hypothetical protein
VSRLRYDTPARREAAMPRVEMATSTNDLLQFFRTEQRLFGVCPHCRAPFRLSDVKLNYGREPPRDVLTKLTRERDRLAAQLAAMEERLDAQQADHAAELDQAQLTWQLQREADVQRAIAARVKAIRTRLPS